MPTASVFTTSCYLCQQTIYFDDEHISQKTGKKIPQDIDSNGNLLSHNCSVWNKQRKYLRCNECDKEIFFDNDHLSKYGKKIPISKSTGNPHRCREKPFNRDTRRAWWRRQQCEAEQERDRRRTEESHRRREEEFKRKFWEEWNKERRTEEEKARDKQQEKQRRQQEQQQRRQQEEAARQRRKEAEDRKRRQGEEEYNRRWHDEQQRRISKEQQYCQILGISMNATNKEINAAYRIMSLKYHPDRCKDLSWEDVNARMAQINEAYENVLLTAK